MIPLPLLAGGSSGPVGQQAYTTPGTYSWTAPAGVTSVCVVCVGPGSLRFAGGLGWKNNIAVTPGNSYTVVVGASDGANHSYFISTSTVAGHRGTAQDGAAGGGGYVGQGGGSGGGAPYSAGGGAGGYTGNGGITPAAYDTTTGNAGSGGGGGSGAVTLYRQGEYEQPDSLDFQYGGGGGGVGLLGQGSNGAGGTASAGSSAGGGGGGSGGSTGTTCINPTIPGNGGSYGGAGAFTWTDYWDSEGNQTYTQYLGSGAHGAVRIIWGTGRFFPSVNTGNL